LATSTLVTFRDRLDAAPETGRELFEFVAIYGMQPRGADAVRSRRSCDGRVIRSTVIRMTSPHLRRSSSLLARSAVAALLLAGGATAAVAATQDAAATAPGAPKVAVLAGSDASASQVGAVAPLHSTVVTTGGGLETQAQAARLAAEGYDTVIAIGAQARAAVAQAQAGEVGTGTRWQISR
jgi:hypothetical protein